MRAFSAYFAILCTAHPRLVRLQRSYLFQLLNDLPIFSLPCFMDEARLWAPKLFEVQSI